jgi:hypothetical protein
MDEIEMTIDQIKKKSNVIEQNCILTTKFVQIANVSF